LFHSSMGSSLVEAQQLLLDPAIRDWVLIPIFIVMLLVGVLRHYITVLITGVPRKPDLRAVRESKALLRGITLRNFGNNIPPHAFKQRQTYLCEAYEQGKYLKNAIKKEGETPVNPMTDPAAVEGMMEGMKKQMSGMVPQMVIMGWVNYFFQGFILTKLPFPLTLRFKSMLQRGVETQDMNVSWVSSLSWYFLNLFGLGSIFGLILGEGNAADGMRDMAAQMPGGMPGQQQGPGQPDFHKILLGEKENLQLTPHKWELEDIEIRVLEKYGKRATRPAKEAVVVGKKETKSKAPGPRVKKT